MTISDIQARAARIILRLEATVVAESAGLSISPLYKFEAEGKGLSKEKLAKLRRFYENHGIEFEGREGLRLRPRGNVMYHGDDEFRAFYDDIYETLKRMGGEVCLFNGVPQQLIKHLGKQYYDMHRARMDAIKNGFNFMVIVAEDEKNLIGSSFVEYRYFPKSLFNDKTIYVYGNKVAFLNFDNDEVQVLVIENGEVADSLRVMFKASWDYQAKKLG